MRSPLYGGGESGSTRTGVSVRTIPVRSTPNVTDTTGFVRSSFGGRDRSSVRGLTALPMPPFRPRETGAGEPGGVSDLGPESRVDTNVVVQGREPTV